MVLFKGNPSAWPSDPKQALPVWEKVLGGGDALLKQGQLKEVGMFTNVEGYAILEAGAKEEVLAMIHPFFPLFEQHVHEIVPWETAKKSLLASAKMAAGMS